MKEIILASTNPHKIKEISHILKGLKVQGINLKVKENGRTFEENAIKKALAAYKKTGKPAIADDSGLEVAALGGLPGVKSARFAGYPITRERLCRKVLKLMKGQKNRKARFVCVIAIVDEKGRARTVKGICPGKIIDKMRGEHGFGYDPIFIPDGYSKTFAEMKPEFKNRISHRAEALKKIKRIKLLKNSG